jgi:hypothetical protein
MPVSANAYPYRVTVHFVVTARDSAGRKATKQITVTQAATAAPKPAPAPAPQPLAIQTSALPDGAVGTAYSAALTATGGTAPYGWSVVGGAVPAGLALSTDGAIAGTPTAAGQFTFTVAVTDADGASITGTFAINVAAPAPTPTVPTATSDNWSGYVLTGGTYTGVKGTFNVPSIRAAPADTHTAEWVGIDGTSPSNPGIVQAGVAEDYSSSTNTYSVTPWVEIFPAPPFRVPLIVAPGDSVTVTISQVAAGLWNIDLKDETTGREYATNQVYNGPGESAEWIVEAPFNTVTNSVETLGAFTPVTFGGLAVNPVTGGLVRVVMYQNGAPVSVPSDITPNGFTVGYGGATPPAP